MRFPMATSEPASPLSEATTTFIESERRRADVAGVAIAVFDRDGVRSAGSFGYADLARDERVTPETVFPAASISKLFTATLVLQEVDAGRLSLDEPVNRHLDPPTRLRDSQGRLCDVTVSHLLTHSSGLPVSWRGLDFGNMAVRRLTGGLRPPTTLREVVEGMRTVREPGQRFEYANGGLSLLGWMVARMHGRRFEELVHERVLLPLGMTGAGFHVVASGVGIATAYGSMFGGAGRTPAPVTRNYTGPAGALYTSVMELSRMGQMVLGGGEIDGQRLVSEALLATAARLQFRNHPGLDEGWGLGFHVLNKRGRVEVGHGGDLPGIEATLAVWPEAGFGAAILTNGGDKAFVARVSDHLFELACHLAPERIPGSPQGVPPALAPAWRSFTNQITGDYRMLEAVPPGLLDLLVGRRQKLPLRHFGEDVVVLDGIGTEPMWLYPDGELGRYRVAHPVTNGARAVIEESAGTTNLWYATRHAQRLGG